ncbi:MULTISPECIES: glutamate 5-kinase [unclassified Corynebacterium]|uniref:glutamate 5-kinase n=1 Tax=unclassified Corynebacterium TaxID=2624378 RepID=UPI002A91A58C|nr:glutamate 5-kinase [Corynebacterium sp.]MDY5784870.1 glutamate 5-kinase [Corynebacterium sp.]
MNDDLSQEQLRQHIATARRIVVKIGTSSLVNADFSVCRDKIDRIVDALEERMHAGSDVIVVSSGAIAAGVGPLGLKSRPRDLATKQAAAAVGQVYLAQTWGESFARHGRAIGQVLLTQADAGRRDRARNAQRTIDRLRQLHAVPIVNENDTVATSEMRFGDNDRLSAIVSTLVSADALVLLSDVDGLYDRPPTDPGARFLSEVRTGNDLADVAAGDGGRLGTGGMAAKVSAARLAARGGVPVLLTSADKIGEALRTAEVGTVFHTRPSSRLSAWKFWALYAADAEGVLRLDAGAVEAVTRGGTSLLAVGITEIEGDFHRGDIVEILGPNGQAVGRGEVAYDAAELQLMLGKSTCDLDVSQRRPVIHADYLSNYATRL